jgi:tetratricopeptide (TPR) repeat protein
MVDPAVDRELLKGKQVAFTGRLASMSRAEAAALVRAHGGLFVSTISRRTSVLVVGQDGWPLQPDGRLSNKLRKTQSLQRAGHRITVLSEEDLLARIGLLPQTESVRRLYSTAQLSRLLKVPGDRLRRWMKEGLIHSVETVNGVSHFDYRQVVSARTLCDLFQAGVTPDRLRRSIRQLRTWMPNVDQPLLQLAVLERNGELLVRLDDGLAEPTGQLRFDFADPADQPSVSLSRPPATAEQWFEQGCQHEESGQFSEAVVAYRRALFVGGASPNVCFNLANALYCLGKKEQALERYYQAVEGDHEFTEAWNNLGALLADCGRTEEAVTALEQALALNPQYADAHYNLADLLEDTGRSADALEHWQAYVAQDQQSEWGRHARGRLAAVRKG